MGRRKSDVFKVGSVRRCLAEHSNRTPARCVPIRRFGEVRIGWIGFAQRQSVSLSAAYAYNVRVPESRSSGAIRSEGVMAEVERSVSAAGG